MSKLLHKVLGSRPSAVIPKQFQWNHDVNRSFHNEPKWIYLPQTSTNPQVAGGKIVFKLPNDGWYDFMEGALDITVTCTATGGTYKRLPQFAWSIIRKITLKQGADTVIEEDHFNLVSTLKYLLKKGSLDEAKTVGGVLYGYSNTTRRNTFGASGRRYMVPLFVEFLTKRPLPLHAVHGELTLEIDLEVGTVIETDGTVPSFSVADAKLWCYHQNLDKEFDNQFRAEMMSGPLLMPITSWHRHFYLATASQTAFSVSIHENSSAVKALLAIMRTQSTLNTTTTNDRMLTFNFNDLSTYQFKHGGELIPTTAINCTDGIEPFLQFIKFTDDWHAHDGGEDPEIELLIDDASTADSDYINGKFILVHNFSHHHGNEDVMSGSDFSAKNIPLTFNMTFGGTGPASTQQVDTFIIVNSILTISPEGKMYLHK
jgi:hypothetical protein